jgi:hypothetical protein
MTKARDLADLGNKTSLDEINDAYDAGALSNRNLIINGAMNVAQRGTSFSGTSGGIESHFAVDRWRYGHKTGAVTITQNGISDLVGFQNSVKVQVTSTSTAATGNQDLFETKIEGQDLVRAGWGLSNAKDLTLSFYYKSNSTDNRVAWFYNLQRGRDFAVIFAASAVNTWERITINIPADQAFDDSNGAGLYIRFVLSSGSQFTTGLASTWSAIGNDRYAGVANFHSSNSNYVEFTGVQLEVGDTATPFEHRSYGDELAKCQRYYKKNEPSVGMVLGGDLPKCVVPIAINNMRATPSITILETGNSLYRVGQAAYSVTAAELETTRNYITFTTNVNGIANEPRTLNPNVVSFDAEL